MRETRGKNIKQTRFILNIFLVEKYKIKYPMLKIPGRGKKTEFIPQMRIQVSLGKDKDSHYASEQLLD
jgi:hypothetical protein